MDFKHRFKAGGHFSFIQKSIPIDLSAAASRFFGIFAFGCSLKLLLLKHFEELWKYLLGCTSFMWAQ